jgi:DNA-binding XRE family transcriptional regulator
VNGLYTILERVGAYCARTGTSREDLANKLGVTRQTLKAKLDGEVEFKLSEAMNLAKILDCTVEDFRQPVFSSGQ